jgi:hypothetical protein
MISRSDGQTFHLFLADRPLPYPLERAAGSTGKVSLCFWYAHDRKPEGTLSTIVILAAPRLNHPSLFRRIEQVADLLAEDLARGAHLADLYEYVEDAEHSLAIFQCEAGTAVAAFALFRKCSLTTLGISAMRFCCAQITSLKNCAMLQASGVALAVPSPKLKR